MAKKKKRKRNTDWPACKSYKASRKEINEFAEALAMLLSGKPDKLQNYVNKYL